MAPEPKKRRLNGTPNAVKLPGKRQKPSDHRTNTIRRESSKAMRLNDLNWKGVTMPDQLDDFEGFFGLEEVDDVEIVKDEKTGAVTFKTAEAQKTEVPVEKHEKKGTYSLVKNALENQNISEQTTADEDMEWNGFGESSPPKDDSEADPALGSGMEEVEVALEDAGDSGDNDEEGSEDGDEVMSDQELGATPFASLSEEDLGGQGSDVSAWKSLKLSLDVMGAISKLGFSHPTLVQQRCIPDIIAGHDVIGKASTGSGKTLAFGIPILEYYLSNVLPEKREQKDKKYSHHPTALILAPTRELAHQLNKHLLALCAEQAFEAPRIATITGGLSVQKQKRQLATADIIIGTPGRLWEVIESSNGLVSKLKRIKFLVVDEADRLLSEGHFKELDQILTALDREIEGEGDGAESDTDQQQERDPRRPRQTLVFSATFHKGLQQKLSGKAKHGTELLNNQQSMEYLLRKLNFREERPKFIDVNPEQQMAQGLRECLVECAGTEKDLYLYALLLMHPKTRTLVFTNSISAVRRITPFLQHLNQPAQALHSNMAQKARLRAIERFTASEASILIATDVAARGLDIPGVQLVVHYHVPRAADMYIHRSGRTARAQASGLSVLICAPEEVQGMRRLIAKVHAQSTEKRAKGTMQTLELDRRVVARLKPRADLAKRIADVALAKEKGNATDKLFAQAAQDLGVEYDSEEFDNMGGGRQGRGNKRKQKQREDRQVGKQELGAWKAELKALLSQRVNTGVSARYITGSGNVDIDALLRGEQGEFLGTVTPLDLLAAEDSS